MSYFGVLQVVFCLNMQGLGQVHFKLLRQELDKWNSVTSNSSKIISLVFTFSVIKIVIQSTSIILSLHYSLIPNKMLMSIIQKHCVIAWPEHAICQVDEIVHCTSLVFFISIQCGPQSIYVWFLVLELQFFSPFVSIFCPFLQVGFRILSMKPSCRSLQVFYTVYLPIYQPVIIAGLLPVSQPT